MKMSLSLFVVALAIFFPCNCAGANIVVLYTVATKSHVYAVLPVVEELAKRGHKVFLDKLASLMENRPIDWFGAQKGGPAQIISTFPWIIQMLNETSEEIFSNQEFLRIVNNRDVDLFLVDAYYNDFLYPVFDKISVPFVTHYATSIYPGLLRAMGAPIDYASVPAPPTEFDNKMTFIQRTRNLVFNELFDLARRLYILKSIEQVVQTHFPGVKSMAEVAGDASLSIINSHPVTNWPRSLPPNIIPIGALHTRPAKPLPIDLQEFADGATYGLIIFTLGSMIPVSSMPKEIVNIFISVFSKLQQKVIWKWEDEEQPNVPANTKMVKWLPQQDLLGHPNTKVFISHGGMLGTQEAAYHGVPILGIPFGFDQRGNIGMAVRSGWGYKLNWDEIKEQDLHDALNYLINNPNVKANATKVSRLMRDEIMPGVDVAVYWIEYVLRHGSAKHMQVAAKNLPFYKLYFIDAAVFIIISLIIFAVAAILTTRAFLRYLTGKTDKSKLM